MRIDVCRFGATTAGIMVLVVGLRVWAEQPTSVREADAACAQCHAKIFQTYVATPMANASGLASENFHPGTFTHSGSSTEYSVSSTGGQVKLAWRSLKDSGIGRESLLYFLGSGHLGTTYLYAMNDFLFESPVAWYASSGSYDMKPGLAEIDRMAPPLPMQSECMRCHMSSVQSSDAGTINHYRGLPFLHSGVTCESCHGDGSQHIGATGKAEILNPARLAPDQRDSICISCHLEGDVTVQRAGHSALNYRPGESISTYLAFYVRSGVNLTDRAVSEVEQFSQSKCRRVSGDRMSCTSCHDPHYTPDAAHRVAFFRGKCLVCHSRPQFAATHHPENQDCTGCHMPQTGARNVLHVAWTDHRIRREPAKIALAGETSESGELAPIFSPGASKRDLAMAHYKELLEGDRAAEPVVWNELNGIRDQLENDKEALDALGNVSAERKDYATAEHAFQRALALDPVDLTALSNLGILLAKEGKLQQAEALLQSAFNRNHDLPGLAKNLARVQCMSGDARAARATLNAALEYGPGLDDVKQLLSELGDCRAPAAR